MAASDVQRKLTSPTLPVVLVVAAALLAVQCSLPFPHDPYKLPEPGPKDYALMSVPELILRGQTDLAMKAIEKGADVNEEHAYERWTFETMGITSPSRRTPLIAAAFAGDIRMMRFLVERGADVNQETNEVPFMPPTTATMISPVTFRSLTPLVAAAMKGNLEMVRYLVEHGANPHFTTTEGISGMDGISAIGAAIGAGNIEVVKYLLGVGAKLRRTDGGMPHFFRSLADDNLEMIRFLVGKGHDPNEPYLSQFRYSKKTPSLIVSRVKKHVPLTHSIIRKKGTRAPILLVQLGADPNQADSDGETALTAAVQAENFKLADFLIKNGAKLNGTGENLDTPLVKAAGLKNLKMAEFLLKRGVDINAPGKNGRTPLIMAASRGHRKMIEFLLERGARVNARDRLQKTALFWANQEREVSDYDRGHWNIGAQFWGNPGANAGKLLVKAGGKAGPPLRENLKFKLLPNGVEHAQAWKSPFMDISITRFPVETYFYTLKARIEAPRLDIDGRGGTFFQIWNRPGALGILFQERQVGEVVLSWVDISRKIVRRIVLPIDTVEKLVAATYDDQFIYSFTCTSPIFWTDRPGKEAYKLRLGDVTALLKNRSGGSGKEIVVPGMPGDLITIYKIGKLGNLVKKREYIGKDWHVAGCTGRDGQMAVTKNELALLFDRGIYNSPHSGSMWAVLDSDSLEVKSKEYISVSHSMAIVLGTNGNGEFLALERGDNFGKRGVVLRKFNSKVNTLRVVYTTKFAHDMDDSNIDAPIYEPYPKLVKKYRALAYQSGARHFEEILDLAGWRGLVATRLRRKGDTFYKGGNDNRTYLQLGNVISFENRYMVVFTGEHHLGRSLDNTRFGLSATLDSRNLGLVIVREDFENSSGRGNVVSDDLVLSKGITETGGFWGYKGKWNSQRNTGVIWLTDYANSEKFEAGSPKAVKLSSGNALVLWEIWTRSKYGVNRSYFSTYAMKIDPNGNVLVGPVDLGTSVRLRAEDDIFAQGNQIFVISGDDQRKMLEVSILKINHP